VQREFKYKPDFFCPAQRFMRKTKSLSWYSDRDCTQTGTGTACCQLWSQWAKKQFLQFLHKALSLQFSKYTSKPRWPLEIHIMATQMRYMERVKVTTHKKSWPPLSSPSSLPLSSWHSQSSQEIYCDYCYFCYYCYCWDSVQTQGTVWRQNAIKVPGAWLQ
jgi:hypothetical protein